MNKHSKTTGALLRSGFLYPNPKGSQSTGKRVFDRGMQGILKCQSEREGLNELATLHKPGSYTYFLGVSLEENWLAQPFLPLKIDKTNV